MTPVNLDVLSHASGRKAWRAAPGGAVSLAVGIAQIFSGIPGHAAPDEVLVSLRHHV